jgi:GPH family glycoside/pentoside/hexuronide:cation symporter
MKPGLPLSKGIAYAIGQLGWSLVADIAEHDALKTGSHREGIYYGARTFMQKIGQMIAMLVFTSLLILGRDVGDDLGVRDIRDSCSYLLPWWPLPVFALR